MLKLVLLYLCMFVPELLGNGVSQSAVPNFPSQVRSIPFVSKRAVGGGLDFSYVQEIANYESGEKSGPVCTGISSITPSYHWHSTTSFTPS